MNNLSEQEYIHIKVRIGNLISSDVFPAKVIRNKDIPLFNKKLDEVINYVEFVIKEHFNPPTQANPLDLSANSSSKKDCYDSECGYHLPENKCWSLNKGDCKFRKSSPS